jgi:hypothetical protein
LQAGGTGFIGIGHGGVAVFLDLERAGPAVFVGIAEAAQRTDARVAAPGKDHLLHAAHADQLIVDQVRGHADQGQVLFLLPDDFVSGGVGNQVGKTFQGDHVAVKDVCGDRVF